MKRPIVLSGNMPAKPECKRPSSPAAEGTSTKSLFQEGSVSKKSSGKREWSDAETTALVQYINLFWDDAASNKWPTKRDPEFWDACAIAVNKACSSLRTGLSKFNKTVIYYLMVCV